MPPIPGTVANEGLWESNTKNVMNVILVTIASWVGEHPKYMYTLPRTIIAPKQEALPKESILPTTNFQGLW